MLEIIAAEPVMANVKPRIMKLPLMPICRVTVLLFALAVILRQFQLLVWGTWHAMHPSRDWIVFIEPLWWFERGFYTFLSFYSALLLQSFSMAGSRAVVAGLGVSAFFGWHPVLYKGGPLWALVFIGLHLVVTLFLLVGGLLKLNTVFRDGRPALA
jgi:hypothetical protein